MRVEIIVIFIGKTVIFFFLKFDPDKNFFFFFNCYSHIFFLEGEEFN